MTENTGNIETGQRDRNTVSFEMIIRLRSRGKIS